MKVLTRQGFMDFEMDYWRGRHRYRLHLYPRYGDGLRGGLCVVYQILYSDVCDHLPEYATLMAMGYQPCSPCWEWWPGRSVAGDDGIRACLACRKGPLLLVREGTSLPVAMNFEKSVFVFALHSCDVHGLGSPCDAQAWAGRSG